MNKTWISIIVIVIIGLGSYYLIMGNKKQPYDLEKMTNETEVIENPSPSTAEVMMKTIQIAEQNESSESGTATLTENEGKVLVKISMTGAPADTAQPAHIHMGSCPDVGDVAYPLTNLVNGVSETTLDVTMDQLKAKLPLGINVHKSANQAKVYVSCGNLTL